jgi:hypothetical protein
MHDHLVEHQDKLRRDQAPPAVDLM